MLPRPYGSDARRRGGGVEFKRALIDARNPTIAAWKGLVKTQNQGKECKPEFQIARCSLLVVLIPNRGYRHRLYSRLVRNAASRLDRGKLYRSPRAPNLTQKLRCTISMALRRALVCELDHIASCD